MQSMKENLANKRNVEEDADQLTYQDVKKEHIRRAKHRKTQQEILDKINNKRNHFTDLSNNEDFNEIRAFTNDLNQNANHVREAHNDTTIMKELAGVILCQVARTSDLSQRYGINQIADRVKDKFKREGIITYYIYRILFTSLISLILLQDNFRGMYLEKMLELYIVKLWH